MSAWAKTAIAAFVTLVFFGIGSWGLLRASVNGERIIGLEADFEKLVEVTERSKKNADAIGRVETEYTILLASLGRIEKGIVLIQTQQKELSIRLGKIHTSQAVANQKLIDHISIDDRRTDKLQDRLNEHIHR